MNKAQERKSARPRKDLPVRQASAGNSILIELVTELAAILLSAGISASEFEHAAKLGFVNAASRLARMGNARVNKSAVAAMTGLSRSEVKRLAEPSGKALAPSRSRQPALRVLDAWQIDGEFVDETGSPRRLGINSEPSEFGKLVRRYGGDIPPKAILRELIRLELVVASSTEVWVKRLDPDKRAMRQVETVVTALAPILARLASNTKGHARLVGRELILTVPDNKAHRLLHRQLNEAVKSFFLNLQNAADGASLPRKVTKNSGRQTQVSVLISD